jgi:hypothetical protein
MKQVSTRVGSGIASLVSIIAFVAWSSFCSGAETVILGAEVPREQKIPLEQVSHGAWQSLLKKYLNQSGLVDYTNWKATAGDLRELDGYLAHLSAAKITAEAPVAARLAFWINAYNAVTVRGILREYPTTSIRNHTAKLFGYNIWQDLLLPVDGKTYSLEQIEHEVLRKLNEPRIHFAIVCASLGCPPLRNEAYVAERIEEQLSANARAFFADRGRFQGDAARSTLALSPILEWFAEDFGDSQSARLKRIAPYLPTPELVRLAESGKAQVSYLDYDWGLNDQAGSVP